MVLDFFNNTMGKILRKSKARIKLTPEGRELIKRKLKQQGHEITDEELDYSLKALGYDITDQLHRDLDTIQRMANKEAEQKLKETRERKHGNGKHRTE